MCVCMYVGSMYVCTHVGRMYVCMYGWKLEVCMHVGHMCIGMSEHMCMCVEGIREMIKHDFAQLSNERKFYWTGVCW